MRKRYTADVLPLFLACTSTVVVTDDAKAAYRGGGSADSGEAPEDIPGDTNTDSGGDSASTEDSGSELGSDRALTAPGHVSITCHAAIPDTGKADCTGTFSYENDDPLWQGPLAVGYHGRSSSAFPKRQLAIELRDDAGVDAQVNLYGLGADGDWLLNGMYIDRAMFRNKIAYDVFRELGGAYAPETTYVELTLNGDFQGLYLLTERVEGSGARIDMPRDEGSGDFFVVKGDETGVHSALQYASWGYVDPADPTAAQVHGITGHLREWETAIAAGKPWDTTDLDDFVLFVLIEELLKNNDAYFLSDHVWRGADEKMHLTPWDLDLTLGQPFYNDNSRSDLWISYRPELIIDVAKTAEFKSRLTELWAEGRAGPLATTAMVERMESLRAFMGPAIDRNWAVWDIHAVQFAGDQLYTVDSPDEEYAAVEAWYAARAAWVDANISAY